MIEIFYFLDNLFVKFSKQKNPPEKIPDGSPMKNLNSKLYMTTLR